MSAPSVPPGPVRRRPCYRDAIEWIALNDDTEWTAADETDPDQSALASPSVTACLAADLFGRSTDEVRQDVRRALARLSGPIPGNRPKPGRRPRVRGAAGRPADLRAIIAAAARTA